MKVVKKGAETGSWKETAVYFESRDKSGTPLYCMYERAGNFMLTVNKEIIRNQNPYNTHAESLYIRRESFIVGDVKKGAYVSNEQKLYKGKPKLSREEFCRHYNNVRLELISRTTYIEI